MSMVYCCGCGHKIHETAPTCPQCGFVQQIVEMSPVAQPKLNGVIHANNVNTKFHIALIVVASIAILLLYTTQLIHLVGIATGLSCGLSFRLFASHKQKNFEGTKQLDWTLLIAFSSTALILHLFGIYHIQALCLIFVAVRALMMYLSMDSNSTAVSTNRKN